MVEVEMWHVPEVVYLLGEQLGHCGAPSLAIPTGRTLVVKARARDDDAVKVWVDGQRAALPSAVASTLADHGYGSGGADIVVESEAAEPADRDDGAVVAAIGIGATAAPDRSEECRRAAEALGLERLAEAGPDAVLRLDDPALKARTRHVITETARVRAATKAIDVGDWTQLGAILTASHESLRDDFEATAAELDVAVEAALEAGALGARASDGAVIALVHQDRVPAVRELVELRFEGVGWQRPEFGTLGPVQRA